MMEYIITLQGHIFLSKNTKIHPKMQKNNKICQLVITNILLGMKEYIHVANLK